MLKYLPRMFICLILAALALAGLWLISPQQLPVVLYKVSLVLLAGVAGYWLDRWIFPYARPDGYLKEEWRGHGTFWPDNEADFAITPGCELAFAAASLRRAAIVAGAMLAAGLGL